MGVSCFREVEKIVCDLETTTSDSETKRELPRRGACTDETAASLRESCLVANDATRACVERATAEGMCKCFDSTIEFAACLGECAAKVRTNFCIVAKRASHPRRTSAAPTPTTATTDGQAAEHMCSEAEAALRFRECIASDLILVGCLKSLADECDCIQSTAARSCFGGCFQRVAASLCESDIVRRPPLKPVPSSCDDETAAARAGGRFLVVLVLALDRSGIGNPAFADDTLLPEAHPTRYPVVELLLQLPTVQLRKLSQSRHAHADTVWSNRHTQPAS
jgi:hypothetical protein